MTWRDVCLVAASVAAVASASGCEEKKTRMDEMVAKAKEPGPSASASAAAASEPAALASAKPASPRQRPPRPLPAGKWGPIQPTAPLEIQQKTLAYTYAMASPDPGDAPVDKAFAEGMRAKFLQAARSLDPTGGDRISVNSTQGDRRLEVELGAGCTEKAPFNLAVQRAGMSLSTLAQSGVFVVQCHDAKWQCSLSTREPDDVICVVAPRR